MNHSKKSTAEAFAFYSGEKYASLQFAQRDEIEESQNRLLAEHVQYAALNSPYYKSLFNKLNLNHQSIKTTFELTKIPFTQKSDLLEFNNQFLATDPRDIVDVCLTSATTGAKATMLMQTVQDIARLAYNEAVAFAMAGIKPDDVLLVSAALDRAFMAGLAYYLGGIKLGALTVRGGSGSAAQNWQLIKTTSATAIVGVPSLMRKIAEYAIEVGESPAQSTVKRLIAIGEPLRDFKLNPLPLTLHLEELWQADVYSTYASTESATSFCECPQKQGGHLRPELIVVEIIGDKDQCVPLGQIGEVVVTPLGVKGMPLLRFRTGDISFLIDGPCQCGRLTPRLGPILGRKNQMLKFKGTTLFPNTILTICEGNPAFTGGYIEVKSHPDGTDRVILNATFGTESFSVAKLEEELRAKLRVVPEIKLISKQELEAVTNQPEKSRKKITFFDLREKRI